MGLGALIWETDRGRPLGTSIERLWRLLWEEDLDSRESLRDELLDEEDEEDLDDDLEARGASKMFRARPVVGSTVDSSLGLWDTW